MDNQKSMKNAYRIAQEMIDDRLKERDPDAYKDLQDVKEADVIVIRGEYLSLRIDSIVIPLLINSLYIL